MVGNAGAGGDAVSVAAAGAGGASAMEAGAGGTAGMDTTVDVVAPPIISSLPSCNGIDGLARGVTLSFELTLPPRPQDANYQCRWYRTDALHGVQEVEGSDYGNLSDGSEALTYAAGEYASTRWQGCRGVWRLSLYPARPPPAGNQMSPLEASSTEVWYVRRTIVLLQAHFCDGLSIGSGLQECEDIFQVAGIELAS